MSMAPTWSRMSLLYAMPSGADPMGNPTQGQNLFSQIDMREHIGLELVSVAAKTDVGLSVSAQNGEDVTSTCRCACCSGKPNCCKRAHEQDVSILQIVLMLCFQYHSGINFIRVARAVGSGRQANPTANTLLPRRGALIESLSDFGCAAQGHAPNAAHSVLCGVYWMP